MAVKIRLAKENDINTLVKFSKIMVEYHSNLDVYAKPDNDFEVTIKNFLKECLKNKKYILFVAEDANKPIGFAAGFIQDRWPVYKIKKVGFISDVFVIPKYRKQGISKLLINRLLKWFKNKKLKYVELTVYDKNDVAKSVWDNCGFKTLLLKKIIKI